jgi:REP element-mobilizing transposase RayT
VSSRQQSFRYRTVGGAREGAGRPAAGPRSIHHDKRIRVRPSEPIHVTCRALGRVANLRTDVVFAAVRSATTTVGRHDDFRIVHMSIQRTHLHLLVEANSARALTRGLCSFLISAARHINRVTRGNGRVFDRYHARSLGTPREVRNCLAYVLNNWRHHREHRKTAWLVDKYSTAIAFDGWKELGAGARFTTVPADYAPLVAWAPRVWLLTTGWLRHGLVSVRERPGGDSGDD